MSETKLKIKQATQTQSGWTFIRSSNGTSSLTKSITFPTAFSSAPIVVGQQLGIYSNASDPTAISDFVSALGVASAVVEDITTTGFTLRTADFAGSTNYCFGFAWMATPV